MMLSGKIVRMESEVEFVDDVVENEFEQQQATHSVEPCEECSPLDLTERDGRFFVPKTNNH
jgi:hypothetical protein